MLKVRMITALALLGVFIPALFYLSSTFWAYLMLGLSIIALYEWGAMIGLNQTTKTIYCVIAVALGIWLIMLIEKHDFHLFFYQCLKYFLLIAIFWLILVPFWLLKRWQIKNKSVLAILGFCLIASLWLSLICAKQVNPWLLLVIISTIWIADSAAYFAGKNYGKHKLAPQISPGKTWEGVLGAYIAVTIFALLIKWFAWFDSWFILPALWVVTLVGIYGDLFESLFKRQANIKDSGQILPGHGGVLDRIDGVIPAMPIAIIMIYCYHYFNSLSGAA